MKFLDLWDEILKEDNIDVHDDYIMYYLLYNQMLKVYVNNKGDSSLNNNINNTNLIGTKEEEVEEEQMEKKKKKKEPVAVTAEMNAKLLEIIILKIGEIYSLLDDINSFELYFTFLQENIFNNIELKKLDNNNNQIKLNKAKTAKIIRILITIILDNFQSITLTYQLNFLKNAILWTK